MRYNAADEIQLCIAPLHTQHQTQHLKNKIRYVLDPRNVLYLLTYLIPTVPVFHYLTSTKSMEKWTGTMDTESNSTSQMLAHFF